MESRTYTEEVAFNLAREAQESLEVLYVYLQQSGASDNCLQDLSVAFDNIEDAIHKFYHFL